MTHPFYPKRIHSIAATAAIFLGAAFLSTSKIQAQDEGEEENKPVTADGAVDPAKSDPVTAETTFAEGPLANPSTGMWGKVKNHILPGSELEPIPMEDTTQPLVLRVVQVFPHADKFRYDFAFFGRTAGQHDLRQYLRRKDGSSMDGVPSIPVEVVPLRPEGELKRPDVESEKPPRVGGYKVLMIAGGVVWVLGLGLLMFGFRKRVGDDGVRIEKPLTLADQLRPLVKKAQSGELSKDGQAELERTLLIVWRKRLDLEKINTADAVIQMRKHDEAGGLLRELEKWLHKPGSADDVDLTELLKPYEKLPAET